MTNFNWGGRGLSYGQPFNISFISLVSRYVLHDFRPLRYGRGDAMGKWRSLFANNHKLSAFIIIFCVLFSGLLVSPAWAQGAKDLVEIQPLKVGDKIPDELWDLPLKVVNHPEGKDYIKLNDYRDKKLIILDFWATWCGSCIASIPKLGKLQEDFKNEIQIVPITKEEDKKVLKFYDQHDSDFLTVVNDRYLSEWFKHLFLPHYVIINGNGIVVAVTSTDQLTVDNISQLLKGAVLSISIKNDRDNSRPLLLTSDAPYDRVQYSSMFFEGLLEGYPAAIEQRQAESLEGVTFTNLSLLKLYKKAYRKLYPEFNDKRFVLDVIDSSGLVYNVDTHVNKMDWYAHNLYSYEILLKSDRKDDLYSLMLEDLNRFSSYQGSIVQRSMTCLKLIKSNETPSRSLLSQECKNGIKYFNQISPRTFTAYLDGFPQIKQIIVDDTGLDKIDIAISEKITDTDALKTELTAQGFDLEKSIIDLPVFVITMKERRKTSFQSTNSLFSTKK
ncbi:TlpA family protein disulfide reductase [Sphingobacterium paucimobilis]|uniref:Thioredoxin domain-containing protein n=1 Tax=Sphingobacterium paucimobilis HER1398 TaxID=1346330 RepID=U2HRL5_9SPHI|nr:TlpA disulfide reductase family protein [Sphingobacterium paucimobilis]ERJ57935.1 hypothetical protein M472_04065 [Sphingobacterium paucimobilis HER1398]